MRPRRVPVVMALLLAGGCAHDLAHASAGATGCAPKEMQISELGISWSETSWRVQCRGLAFRCTGEGNANCMPEPKPTAVAGG